MGLEGSMVVFSNSKVKVATAGSAVVHDITRNAYSLILLHRYSREYSTADIHCFAVKIYYFARRWFFQKSKNYPTTYLTPTAQNTLQTNNQLLCFTISFYHHHHNHRHCHHHHHRYHSTCFVLLAASRSCQWRSTSDPNDDVIGRTIYLIFLDKIDRTTYLILYINDIGRTIYLVFFWI